MDLSESTNNKDCVKNPELIEKEKILKNMLIFIVNYLNFTILYVSGNCSLLILLFLLNLRKCIVTVYVVG